MTFVDKNLGWHKNAKDIKFYYSASWNRNNHYEFLSIIWLLLLIIYKVKTHYCCCFIKDNGI